MIDIVGALALGLGLGVLTGMPLGVINVAIVDAVIARESRHARGLALGGALADAMHTLLAFVGFGRLVTARPDLARYLAIAAALAITIFAILSWRRRRKKTGDGPTFPVSAIRTPTDDGSSTRDAPSTHDASSTRDAPSTDTSIARGVLSGIAMTLPNPAALGAWVAVAAMTWPHASIAVAASVALGVGVGSAVWFTLLGWLVSRVPPEHRALRIVPRVALALFVVIAVVGVARAM